MKIPYEKLEKRQGIENSFTLTYPNSFTLVLVKTYDQRYTSFFFQVSDSSWVDLVSPPNSFKKGEIMSWPETSYPFNLSRQLIFKLFQATWVIKAYELVNWRFSNRYVNPLFLSKCWSIISFSTYWGSMKTKTHFTLLRRVGRWILKTVIHIHN